LLICAAALLAVAGCNKKNDNSASSSAAADTGVKITQATPPPGGDWSDVVNATSAGYMMGNPNAKVKLVEIGSLFCPYCKKFEDEGSPLLVAKYVKPGNVSWEFRPYVIHGPIDLAANIVARCAGTKAFFPLTKALYKDQTALLAKMEATPQIGRASSRERVTNAV
jgi:protein-disulfide isomerase